MVILYQLPGVNGAITTPETSLHHSLGTKTEDTIIRYGDPGRGHSSLHPASSSSSRPSAFCPFNDDGSELLLPAGPLFSFSVIAGSAPLCSHHALHKLSCIIPTSAYVTFSFCHLLLSMSTCQALSYTVTPRSPMLHANT